MAGPQRKGWKARPAACRAASEGMKKRVLTGIIGLSLLFLVLFFLPAWCLNIFLALLSALAMYEILQVTHLRGHKGLLLASLVFSLAAPFLLMWHRPIVVVFAVVVYAVVLGLIQLHGHESLPVERTGFVFCMTLLVPLALSCVAYLRADAVYGRFYVVLVLVLSWLCDIGGYFIGTFFGRHKLCPQISPKKTVEGFVGGLLLAIGGAVLAAWIYRYFWLENVTMHYLLVLLLAAICAPLSVLGDLFASIIKRQNGAKDYGHLFPGHGGVMDRFDSLIFVAPVTYLFIQAFPLIR